MSLESRQKNIRLRDLLLYFLWETGLYAKNKLAVTFTVKGLYNYG